MLKGIGVKMQQEHQEKEHEYTIPGTLEESIVSNRLLCAYET